MNFTSLSRKEGDRLFQKGYTRTYKSVATTTPAQTVVATASVVWDMALTAAGTVNATFYKGAVTTAIFKANLIAGLPFIYKSSGVNSDFFLDVDDSALKVTLSAAQAVDIFVKTS